MKKQSNYLKLSASSIKTYESCARKWFYSYIEKREKKEWEHLDLGNFIHNILEQFHNELMVHPELEMGALLTFCFDNQMKQTKPDGSPQFKLGRESKIKAHDMLQVYLQMLRRDGVPDVVANEQSFSIQLDDDLEVRGYIDRIDRDEEGGYRICDYKSGRSSYLDEFQLLVYGLYIAQQHPELEKFKGEYICLKEKSKHLSYTFSRTDLDRCINKIKKVANQIRADQTWEPKPSFLCKYCDFEEICPASGLNAGKADLVKRGQEDWVNTTG